MTPEVLLGLVTWSMGMGYFLGLVNSLLRKLISKA